VRAGTPAAPASPVAPVAPVAAPAAGAASREQKPAVRRAVAAPPARAAHPELFSFDDDDDHDAAPAAVHEISLVLSAEQHARLSERATRLGVSVEDALRALI